MHLGLNGYFWGQETTGSGQYLAHLVWALAAQSPQDRYTLFVPEPAAGSALPPSPAENVHLRALPFRHEREQWAKLAFEQWAFPRACRQAGVELAHVPYFASPLFPTRPTVVTVHDLIPLLLPAYRGDLRVRSYTQLVSWAAQRADAVLTDSEASRQDILRLLGIPAERVHAVWLAAEERFQPASDPQALADWRAQQGLPERYLLYLGGVDQRRNLETLLRAVAELARRWPEGEEPPRLVLAGKLPQEDTAFFPDPRRMVRELGLERVVQCIGRVAEEDKPWLYNAADFFVFPSLYEGFGLPPLEAMACGVPVIVSERSSLPEIVGDGGLLVPPLDVSGWAQAIEALWTQPERRRALRERALVQAARFSWARTARETEQVYRAVVAQKV